MTAISWLRDKILSGFQISIIFKNHKSSGYLSEFSNLIFKTNMDEIFDQIQEMNTRIDASWGSEDYSEYAEQETD